MTTIATECNVCPKGIKACTHMDGKVVWLFDTRVLEPHIDGLRLPKRWSCAGPGPLLRCMCAADHVVITELLAQLHNTDSLADAEAEYERRCALMRAGP